MYYCCNRRTKTEMLLVKTDKAEPGSSVMYEQVGPEDKYIGNVLLAILQDPDNNPYIHMCKKAAGKRYPVILSYIHNIEEKRLGHEENNDFNADFFRRLCDYKFNINIQTVDVPWDLFENQAEAKMIVNYDRFCEDLSGGATHSTLRRDSFGEDSMNNLMYGIYKAFCNDNVEDMYTFFKKYETDEIGRFCLIDQVFKRCAEGRYFDDLHDWDIYSITTPEYLVLAMYYSILKNGVKFTFCKNCGRPFISQGKRYAYYCDTFNPELGMSCRDYNVVKGQEVRTTEFEKLKKRVRDRVYVGQRRFEARYGSDDGAPVCYYDYLKECFKRGVVEYERQLLTDLAGISKEEYVAQTEIKEKYEAFLNEINDRCSKEYRQSPEFLEWKEQHRTRGDLDPKWHDKNGRLSVKGDKFNE